MFTKKYAQQHQKRGLLFVIQCLSLFRYSRRGKLEKVFAKVFELNDATQSIYAGENLNLIQVNEVNIW